MKVDYLLIGAGMAGLVLRKFLDSPNVVLVDQNPGAYKIGESVVPEQFQHPVMRALLPAIEKLPSYSAKCGTTFVSEDAIASFPLPPEEDGVAMHVARAELEQLLVREWNIPIHREKVLEIDVANHVVKTDANTYEVAKQIIDCSGPAMVLASRLGDVRSLWPVWATWSYHDVLENDDALFWTKVNEGRQSYLRYDALRRRVLRGSESPDWSAARTTILTRNSDGIWTWQIPLYHSKLVSFGVVSRHGPVDARMYNEITAKHASPNFKLQPRPYDNATPYNRLHSREGFARRAGTAATQDYILLADAYGFADPVYSVGTAVAVNKAIELAGVLNERGWDTELAASWNVEAERLLQRAISGFEFWYSGELLKSDAAANEVRDNFLLGTAFQAQAAKHYGTLLNDASLAGYRGKDDPGALAWVDEQPGQTVAKLKELLSISGAVEEWQFEGAASRPGGVLLRWTTADKPELTMDIDFCEPAHCFMRVGKLGLSMMNTFDGPYPFDRKVARLFDAVVARIQQGLPAWEALTQQAVAAKPERRA